MFSFPGVVKMWRKIRSIRQTRELLLSSNRCPSLSLHRTQCLTCFLRGRITIHSKFANNTRPKSYPYRCIAKGGQVRMGRQTIIYFCNCTYSAVSHSLPLIYATDAMDGIIRRQQQCENIDSRLGLHLVLFVWLTFILGRHTLATRSGWCYRDVIF